jgi:hypothetical protein
MPRLRALVSSSEHKAGEEFDASEADAKLLCTPDAIGGPRAQLVDRALQPVESESPNQSEPAPPSNRRRYMRRDLRAQS